MPPRRAICLALVVGVLASAATVDTARAADETDLVIDSLTLVNATTNQPISGYGAITGSRTIDLATLPTRQLNVRITTDGADVVSVRIEAGGTSRVDGTAPFSAFGDTSGDYDAWQASPGELAISATAHARARGKGRAGPTFAATLNFVDTAVRPGPTPTPMPTSAPLPTAAPTASPPSSPAPTTAPTASPSPAPTMGVANVSGIVIPPPIDGYRRVHFTEFPNLQSLGQAPHPDTALHLKPRPNAADDCTYRDSSGRGLYCWRKTTSEGGGVLRQWLHTETTCGMSTTRHDASGACHYVNAPLWTEGKRASFVVSVVARFDDLPGRKVAYLRWCGPRVGEHGYCEDNFPEMQLSGGTCKGYAFHHHASRTTKESFAACVNPNQWHLYQMHVSAGQHVTFRLDGQVIGRSTQYVTSDPTFWVAQAETLMSGTPLPTPHAQGFIEWDSFAVDLPSTAVLVSPTPQ